MKALYKYAAMLALSTSVLSGCSKFEEINEDPYLVTEDQVQVEYFINNAIMSAQQDPHIAERIFVLYWKTAGHQQLGGGISTGTHNDGWSSDYYGSGYMGGWLNAITTGIQVAERQIANGTGKSYTNNLMQIARIWRAYLMSELADTFGPIPVNAFQGTNPEFSSVKDVYYFMLEELKDASSKLDLQATKPDAKFDLAYGFDYAKWQKYANSMRLRLAMRLSEVDQTKAKSEFEAAAALPLLLTAGENYQIQEKTGWDALTGVMTREWNYFPLSATQHKVMIGLGGIPTADQVTGADKIAAIKPIDYIGLKLDDHFTSMTNDPYAGYWLDGLPEIVDPRAYKAFVIPGDVTNPDFNAYPSWDQSAKTTQRNLVDDAGAVVKTIDAKNTWNASVNGDWGSKGAKNQVRAYNGAMPRLAHKFRNSSNKRMFFANWETYFLLAEGAARGWAVPMSGQDAYEAGISASFEYWGVSNFAAAYKASTSYNRNGTSVSWTHTAEPGNTRTMTYVNGYTNTPGTVTVNYPVNNLYKGGAVRNDLITKIITQKFIAQNPWLPLETWNDHRRLGLPFFENPAIERPLVNMPALTAANYKTSQVNFFPQRIKYPSSLSSSNQAGYNQAVGLLGGPDDNLTPLWWAQKP
ncbi:SusD/RagB family nutrient-binding outer membrane lipoprotein [Flavihumibacter stibioxidans]|uniref:Susd and RagB outer membrane lipoprotein domain protein n=1 Tax=Flavihumibacter stibioxidans TaxID=1834163 RepID=A0ABR7MAG5_9BACT|nr:SusD/RagB family nutrient-binding outer membrane lipoprotein [Flavihumibacter stibioxidans]MBC6492015.1 susd and RagB outer membrane lipoprotein domain protein [Flavihumibacter stibioxidans]